MDYSPETQKSNILLISKHLGFSECKISAVKRATHADDYLSWVDLGYHGEMAWLERNKDKRVHPGAILEGAKSIISLAYNYYPGDLPDDQGYKIARYSWNDDYHDIIEEKLRDIDLALTEMGGRQRYYVDTGPVLERDFANDAGLGWNGKSCIQINKKFGNYFFICELITTLDLAPDSPFGDHCGKCTRCMDQCPTNAFIGPRKLDAKRCISYLTIEHSGSIPLELRPLMSDRIYGCDVCLEVCPWNRFAQISRDTKLHARTAIFDHSLQDFARMNIDDFRKVFAKSPIKRIKHPRFIRNVCVALGNTGDHTDLPQLAELASSDDPLISEHAQWAIDEINRRHPSPAL